MLVHFSDLKRDMPGQMRRIAEFLAIPIDESRWDSVVEYCSFDWMKANAVKSVPLGGGVWDAGAHVFICRGVNGRWSDHLSEEECTAYEERCAEELSEECARWLRDGTPGG
jgi:aryl sulfotransferase